MKKFLITLVLLACSVVLAAGFNFPVQPYVSGSMLAPVGSQQQFEVNRILLALWAYPNIKLDSTELEILFEYDARLIKTNWMWVRASRPYHGWNFSVIAGRHKSPGWYNYPNIHGLRLTRFPITLEAITPKLQMVGAGVWLQRGEWLAARVSCYDSTNWAGAVTAFGVGPYWQDGAGWGVAANVPQLCQQAHLPWIKGVGLQMGYAHPDSTMECGHAEATLDLPYSSRLHYLVERRGCETHITGGVSVEYAPKSFIQAFYDGLRRSACFQVTYFASL